MNPADCVEGADIDSFQSALTKKDLLPRSWHDLYVRVIEKLQAGDAREWSPWETALLDHGDNPTRRRYLNYEMSTIKEYELQKDDDVFIKARKILMRLLTHNPRLHSVDGDIGSRNIFHEAAIMNSATIFDLFSEHCDETIGPTERGSLFKGLLREEDKHKSLPISLAVDRGHGDAVQKILMLDTDILSDNKANASNLLQTSIERGDISILKELLSRKPGLLTLEMLRKAVNGGHDEVFGYLMEEDLKEDGPQHMRSESCNVLHLAVCHERKLVTIVNKIVSEVPELVSRYDDSKRTVLSYCRHTDINDIILPIVIEKSSISELLNHLGPKNSKWIHIFAFILSNSLVRREFEIQRDVISSIFNT